MPATNRKPLPHEAAAAIQEIVTNALDQGNFDPVELAPAIIELIQRQVVGIPGAPEVSVGSAALKLAEAAAKNPTRVADWILVLLQRTIDPILKSLAVEVRPCAGYRCKRIIAMVPDYTQGGRLIPFDFGTALNHYITCPDRDRFKRPAGSVDPKQPLPPGPVERTVQAVDAGVQQEMFDRSRRPD